MATLKGGARLETALRKIAAQVSKPATLRAGFLEGATYPDGTSVALVAAVQEFGSPSRNIPPRPFFRNMIAKERSHWSDDIGTLLKANEFDASKTMGQMGEEIAGELRQSIVDFDSVPLKPRTIARKGSEKQLVDTGHLLQSIDYEVSSE